MINNETGDNRSTNTLVFRVNVNGNTRLATDETAARFLARREHGFVECCDDLSNPRWFRCSW